MSIGSRKYRIIVVVLKPILNSIIRILAMNVKIFISLERSNKNKLARWDKKVQKTVEKISKVID